MIIDEKVKVKMSHWYIDHYRKLGYKVKKKDIIEVPIEHLSYNDPVKVNAKCDKCGSIKEIRYKDYLINKSNHYFSCSYKCSRDKVKMTNIEKFGVENPFQNEKVKEKIKETCIEKFGTERASQSNIIKEKVKNTNTERFGVEYRSQLDDWSDTLKETWSNKTEEEIKEIMDRKAETNLEKYGVDHVLQSEHVREALKNAALERYNVDHFLKSKEIHEKQQSNGFKAKRYKNTNLIYRGSYELDFLEKYYDEIKIENGPSIKYQYNDKNRVYHSDFYLPERNLIVEIKSDWTYRREIDKNLAKKIACLEQDFNFIFIIDKNYNELNELLLNI